MAMDVRAQRKFDNYVGRFGIALLRPLAMLLGALLRRDHRISAGKEIVWVKMLGGGSLLLAFPALLGIRRAYPNTKMVLITTPGVRPFAELTGVFDEYRIIDNRGVFALMWSALRVMFTTFRADCIIDLEVHSRLTTVFTTLTMARNRVSFWLEDIFWRKGLASHLIFFNRSSGSFHFYDRIADLFDVKISSREECRDAMLAACGAEAVPKIVEEQVAIGFACSELGRERMLSPEQWAIVFRDNLKSHHRRFLFLGGPADRVEGDAIIAALRPTYPQLEFQNTCGELELNASVREVFASVEFWGIDSSLVHIARIAGRKCVSYWGPTEPATRLRTDWAIEETTHYHKIACSPCVHTSEEPPCGGDNRCIQNLFTPGVISDDWTPIAYPIRRKRALTS
jgi:ADP-heptose:LPS heptosyltransferase